MRPVIVLPSYNPDEKLLAVVEGLTTAGFNHIVVVNDGSDEGTLPYFENLYKYKNVKILTHDINKGKGRALKTAFEYLLQSGEDFPGVITVDGDNQHHIDDVVALEKIFLLNQQAMVLGCRSFDGEDVPARSSFGNKITSCAFALMMGMKISDTQTGLRAIPKGFLKDLIDLNGERFEFETNVLLESKKAGIRLIELPIRTIYIEENKTSHYRPIVDSMKIIGLMLRFTMTSGVCALLDLGIYWAMFKLLSGVALSRQIFIATVVARVISSMVNFILNRKTVFPNNSPIAGAIVRYYILCGVIMLCSYGGVLWLTAAFGTSVVMKLVVDSLLYILSFNAQKNWVFK